MVQASEQASPLASVPKVSFSFFPVALRVQGHHTQSLKQSESSKSTGKHSSGTASQVSPQASSSSRRPSQTSSASSCFVHPFTATIKCLLLSQSQLCLCSHVNEEMKNERNETCHTHQHQQQQHQHQHHTFLFHGAAVVLLHLAPFGVFHHQQKQCTGRSACVECSEHA